MLVTCGRSELSVSCNDLFEIICFTTEDRTLCYCCPSVLFHLAKLNMMLTNVCHIPKSLYHVTETIYF